MNKLQIPNIILKRRSVYPAQMDPNKKIERRVIEKLLEAANYAPSHKRTEPWRFVVFADDKVEEFYAQLLKIYKGQSPDLDKIAMKQKKWKAKAKTVSHVIAVYMKRDEKLSVPKSEEEWAVACAVQNILLSAESLGVCGYWGTGELAYSAEMKDFLNLSENDQCMGFLQMGIMKEGLNMPDKKPISPIDGKVEWR